MTTRTMRRRRHLDLDVLEGRALLSAGALDTSFGGTGMVASLINGKYCNLYTIAVQPNQQIVAAGSVTTGAESNDNDMAIVRYNADGTLDSSFGSGGAVVLPIGANGFAAVRALAIQPDGKIVAAGFAYVKVGTGKKATSVEDFAVVRLNANGSLDTTFGGTGEVLTSVSSLGGGAQGVLIQSDGKIVVTGGASVTQGSSQVVAQVLVRYNTNGSIDTSFGTGGMVVNTAVSWFDIFTVADNSLFPGPQAVLDSSGRIDLVGTGATNGTADELVVDRYLPSGALDPSFGSGGMVVFQPAGATVALARSLALQSTGDIIAYAQCTFSGGPHALIPTLVRFTPNGSLDTSFGSGGLYSDSRLFIAGSVVIDPTDDNIVITAFGWVNGSRSAHLYVERVLANGSSYDPTFGTNGLAEANFGSTNGEFPVWVALDSSGRIVVGGEYDWAGPYTEFAVARFLGS